ncbi:MAG: hypothetical protein HXO19_11610 [Prevotella shahii]|nr:hypothetical protein [Hoylesella shahii]
MDTIKLKRVGRNANDYTVYKDEYGNHYLDISAELEMSPAELYMACPPEDVDGEAGFKLIQEFIITNPYSERDIREHQHRHQYMMLSRIYDDLKAYVGKTGNKDLDGFDCRYQNPHLALINEDVSQTIEAMRKYWDAIPADIKPEWCTAEDIANIEIKARLMAGGVKNVLIPF